MSDVLTRLRDTGAPEDARAYCQKLDAWQRLRVPALDVIEAASAYTDLVARAAGVEEVDDSWRDLCAALSAFEAAVEKETSA